MRQAKLFVLAALVILMFGSIVRAGDYATLNFIGFSQDGKYLAFEQYGVQDESGFPYSSYYFIDVAKNAFAVPPVQVRIDNELATQKQARTRAKLRSAATLRRLRIVSGNTGQLTVARMLTDLSLEHPGSGKPQRVNFAEIVDSMYRSGNYELVLNPVEVKVKTCQHTDQPIYKFDLSLRDKDADKTVILQKDGPKPLSDFCLSEFAIQFVYLYKENIAVFLNIYDPGFEGPDMRYLVVTGKYK
jgi:predicted secreted protein